MKERPQFDPAKIEAFCREHLICKLAFFGSVLRNDFRTDSDVDVLVEFEPGKVPGLAFFAMQRKLSVILGRTVDLTTPRFFSPRMLSQVLSEAEVKYAQA